ncbi:NAD(P)-dependent oxidoreductase [Trichococcus shcherbakoviae]|uniref:NAD(P)-dependent oxidoreductase n=1 Tax=Trichococcus shcherbakoviae TaxID=2094020 RepID=UPI002AA6C17A|nr:NAD(P)H-binding protein [Trichococcus shcherbakoviae]
MKNKQLNIAIIGHTGMGGSELTNILLERGHKVTGISLDADRAAQKEGLTNIVCNIMDVDALAEALEGHDAVVSAFSGGHEVNMTVYYRQVEGTRCIKRAFKKAKGKYLIYIGGAASLYVAPGIQMFDDPKFPRWYFGSMPPEHLRWLADITREEFFNEAAERKENGTVGITESDKILEEDVKDWTEVPLLEGCRMALELFEGDYSFEWSFLSPPWFYRPGAGTGKYELGVDFMLMKDGVPASISVPDLQKAVADEVENQALIHKHWTVKSAG